MKRYVISCENPQKVGTYYFCGFHRYKPTWESNMCRQGKTKGYKDYATVKQNIKRLKAIYPTCSFFLTEYGECTTGAILKIYWSDEVTVEERYFDTGADAEDYCKRNGVVNYELEAKTIRV